MSDNNFEGMTLDQVDRELKSRLADVASIREANGGTLVGVKGADAERVADHMRATNALGERRDELLAEQGDDHFDRLSEFLNDPATDIRRPGSGANGGGKPAEQRTPADVGGLFVSSEAWKAYVETGALNKSVSVPTESLFGRGIKGIGEVPASGLRQAALFDSTGYPTRQDIREDFLVDTLYQPNNIGSLMPQGQTDSDTIRYPVETVTATGATEVAEGATKPEAQISFADTDEPVRTIAVLLPVTNKALRNAPFMRAYINARLRLFVQMREDSQLLNGNGTAPNIRGILNRSGINTATSYSIAGANPDQALIDAVFKAAMRVREAYLEPDAAVMRPATWELAALAKDGNRNYLLGGPGAANYVAGDPSPRLWGLRVVLNANMPAQAATAKPVLVGSFGAAAMVVRRGDIELALSESHGTFFAENKVMLRAEEEVALCVFRPAGFAAVTSAA
jgi:HK97 family phage major capsid protein